jgi:hypothetical protein
MADPSIEHLWSALWTPSSPTEDFRLRFELGGEEFNNTVQQVPRFLQAHLRASAVADALFTGACVGIVAWNGRTPYAAGFDGDVKDGFVALQSTGFAAPQITQWRACLYPEAASDEPDVWTLRSYDLVNSKVARDTLLWHAIAAEMPIHPSAPVVIFLIDPDAPVMLHVYDDRGMDVISDDPAKLQGIYFDFADWLLDYDRSRMARLF